MELTVDRIAHHLDGKLVQGDPQRVFRSWSIDSRLTRPGDLFFALISERNGHDFVSSAASRGAAGAVISQPVQVNDPDFVLIRVPDTLDGMQRLAAAVLRARNIKVIGITGSIGKTTAKEFTASLLSGSYRVLKSQGNFNNQIGLPLTLLDIENHHSAAVLEMGMNHPGEIAHLTRVAPPDVAVITNINPVHLEFFNSLEEIAEAKKEILTGLKPGGTAVLNTDDPLVQNIRAGWPGKAVTFGREGRATVMARDIRRDGLEHLSFELVYGDTSRNLSLPLVYRAYVSNVLAAAAAAYALGMPADKLMDRALNLRPLDGRGRLIRLNAYTLIDDTYNSNPRALSSALADLGAVVDLRKVAVLGDMLELGQDAQLFHRDAGRAAASAGWSLLVTVGSLARHMARGAREAGMNGAGIHSYETSAEAAEKLPGHLKHKDLILVKGSRGMRMETIISQLKSEAS